MKNKAKLLGAAAVALPLLILSAPASAVLISATNASQVVVDGNPGTPVLRSVNIAAGGTVADVNILIDFMKCDNPLSTPLPAACIGQGASFAREIVFDLISPLGTVVSLVAQDTYFPLQAGPAPGARVQVLFDDAAATQVGGNALISGIFSPVGSLASFIGESVTGQWTLTIADTVGLDPLGFASFRLDVDAVVPEPASLALLGIGLAGLGFARKKRAH